MKNISLPAFLALGAVLVTLAAQAAPSKVTSVVQAQNNLDKSAANSQKKIDKISSETQAMLNQYLQVAQQNDQLRAYDDQMQQFIQSQQDQMTSLTQQTSQVSVVEEGLPPLMQKMVDSLQQFIKLDIPYKLDERLAAVQQLRETVNDASVSATDKYSKIIAAYNAEIAAGKTMGSYRGDLTQGGHSRTVNFLRVGHLVLAYQTLDHSETGYWDKQKQAWVVDNKYADAVAEGIAIANKQAAPDVLKLPVTAPEVAK
ncbi:MAG TPA: DUF3450 domain-containing protein [Gammaproteobacteria bacterium]|jgi:hypothetical protein|nr:DUF3450 domain-containing protein [Gammaproteobacteria bacterium]